MDLSKAFYTINHDLLWVKLRAYGFSASALNIRYFNNSQQKVAIYNKTSSSEVVIAGVPQASLDGLLLLNLLIKDVILYL